MTSDTDLHPLAQSYLDRLAEAARVLPPHQANELVVDISDHLHEALRPNADEAEVRTALDRLGTPQELVIAAGGPLTPPHTVPAQAPTFGAVEIWSLMGLGGAELLFFVLPVAVPLWLVGVVLLTVSRVWSGRQKAWGLAVLATGFPVALTVLAATAPAATTVCDSAAVATEVGLGGTVTSTMPTCVSEGGWPDWVFTVVQVLFALYLCLQVWTLWRLTRRR